MPASYCSSFFQMRMHPSAHSHVKRHRIPCGHCVQSPCLRALHSNPASVPVRHFVLFPRQARSRLENAPATTFVSAASKPARSRHMANALSRVPVAADMATRRSRSALRCIAFSAAVSSAIYALRRCGLPPVNFDCKPQPETFLRHSALVTAVEI